MYTLEIQLRSRLFWNILLGMEEILGEWGIFRHPVCYASRLYRFIWYNISIILEYFEW